MPKVFTDMSITTILVKEQEELVKKYKIEPDGDNPLDLCRIFSRHRYANDIAGVQRKKDQRIVNRQAQIIEHDHNQTVRRVNRDRHRVHIHRNMIRVKAESAFQQIPVSGGGKRGNVAGFSRASRKRMIDLMCSQREGAPKTFVSLTYADEALFDVTEHGEVIRLTHDRDWKRDIEVLRKRFERQFPNIKAIWRIELQDRKSGKFRGLIAPHFHMLIWNMTPTCTVSDSDTDFQTWLNQQWWEIVDTGLSKHYEHGTHISLIETERHAMFYVSKYVAKAEDEFEDNYEIGRRWGRIGQFDTGECLHMLLNQREFVQFRRLIRSWLKSHGRDYAKRLRGSSLEKGFTVYGLGDGLSSSSQFLPDGLIKYMVFHARELAVQFLSVDS